ncbi:MAG: Mur ligase family protein, partial [Bacteroidota bacterium]
NTLNALQQLAAHHRTANQQPSTDNLEQTTPNRQPTTVIGITGSNGKTIVKEWLYQLLQEDENIVRSPKSYNSQIGVPLSVWELEPEHTLGIFEAGISQKGEMEKLASIIQPTIGVFTFLGDAHKEGFENDQEKVQEKCKLFETADTIIYPSVALGKYIQKTINKKFITWGKENDDDLKVLKGTIEQDQTIVQVQWENKIIHLHIPFTDKASIHNALTCCCVCLHLDMTEEKLTKRIQHLEPVGLRLEIKKGIQGCTLLNDAYTADLNSLEIAIHLLLQQSGKKSIILSDFILPENEKEKTYQSIAELIHQAKIERLITIGNDTENILKPLISGKVAIQ